LVEEFYDTRRLPTRYQLSPVATPPGLDELLAERGYETEARVDVQTAPLGDVLRGTSGSSSAARLTAEPDDRWLALWTELFKRGDPAITKERLLDRIAPPAGFVLLEREGDPVAVGYGVVERGWLGIFSMGTVAQARRRGLATHVLHELARWASGLAATECYLQVEEGNEPAHRLYERAGFRTLYSYHYRTRRS
jgi:GNAT superfamily N-acetyltransferase